jgi:NADH-quinone oxidoreductase subunit J
MNVVFLLSAAIAVLATLMAILQRNLVRALLYMIASLLSVAVIFFILGAPMVAALEIIIYAGAIMVLFVFVLMMLDVAPAAQAEKGERLALLRWLGPGLLSLVLLGELIVVLLPHAGETIRVQSVSPKQLGLALFGPYLLAVELASLLLLSGLIGAFHLARQRDTSEGETG